MTPQELSTHLHAQAYDKLYQDIQCLGLVGYSKSHKSWATIQNIIDWKGLSVIELGCFHGYFCFRAEQTGAIKVLGLDILGTVLETTRKIAKLEESDAVFQQWNDTQEIPPGDVTLCLNALHHFSDPLGCLQRIQSERAIFEVNLGQTEMISSVFEIESHHASHRKNRTIILGRKRME